MKKMGNLFCCVFLSLTLIPSCSNSTYNESKPNSDYDYYSETSSLVESTDTISKNYTEVFNFGCAMNLLTRSKSNNGYIPIDTQILEYCGVPMEFVLTTSAYSDHLSSNVPIKLRIMVMQDGKLLNHSLDKDGTPNIYNDVYVTPDTDFYTSIYFEPLCNFEYSAVTVICEYLPDDIPEVGTGEYCGAVAFSKLIKINTKTPYNTEIPAANYEVLPDNLQSSDDVIGVAIGSELNAPVSYRITDNHGAYEDITLSSKSIFLKANIISNKTHYAMILCDGLPIQAFGEDYTIAFNCENGTRTLNEKINLTEELADGIHVFQAIVVEHNTSADQIDTANYITNKIRINIDASPN